MYYIPRFEVTKRTLGGARQPCVLQYIFHVVSGAICYLYTRLVYYRSTRDFLSYCDVQKMASLKTDSTAQTYVKEYILIGQADGRGRLKGCVRPCPDVHRAATSGSVARRLTHARGSGKINEAKYIYIRYLYVCSIYYI